MAPKKTVDSIGIRPINIQTVEFTIRGTSPLIVHAWSHEAKQEMLDKQRELVTPHVIFGGKNPHPHYVVGGMPCSISMNDGNAPVNAARLAVVDRAINMGRTLVNNYYLPDLLAIGSIYVKAGRLDGGGLA